MAAISACHGSPNPKSNKLCCFIIWAGICPNSLRPEFIPINFKALVWQTGAVPEKPSRSKSVTYANPTLKTAKLRLTDFCANEKTLSLGLRYIWNSITHWIYSLCGIWIIRLCASDHFA